MHFATRLARESARTVTREDILERRVVALEARLAELEALLRNVTPVTPVTGDRNVTRNAAGNASNAERQRRYRERQKNKNSPSV